MPLMQLHDAAYDNSHPDYSAHDLQQELHGQLTGHAEPSSSIVYA